MMAAIVATLLLGAIAVATELFVVAPFFSQHSDAARWTYNALLVSGVGLLGAGEFAHYWRCRRKAQGAAKKTERRPSFFAKQ